MFWNFNVLKNLCRKLFTLKKNIVQKTSFKVKKKENVISLEK